MKLQISGLTLTPDAKAKEEAAAHEKKIEKKKTSKTIDRQHWPF